MLKLLLRSFGCSVVTTLLWGPALAAGDATALATTDPVPAAERQPLWEAGVVAFGGSQQAYPGARQQVSTGLALPFLVYRGRILRSEQGGVGVRAARTATTEVDIGFAGSFGSAASDNDARRGLPDIGLLIEFGPRLKLDLGNAPFGGQWRASLPLRGVVDVSNSFDFRGVAFEPDIGWGRRNPSGWGYGATLGVLVGNRRLADTFYGVAPAYVTADRPAYEARGGLIATRLGVNMNRRIGADWRFFVYGRVDTVAGATNRNSPLVGRTTGASAGLGFAWTGLRSSRSAED